MLIFRTKMSVRIIAHSDNFTWNQRKQGNFAFVDQRIEDNFPALRYNKVTKDLMLDWVEEGTLPKPMDTIKDTPGCLRKVRKKHVRYHVVSFMSTLPLIFWKISFDESNRFAHQEIRKAKEKGLTENNICGAKWKHDITLGELMVFFGILLWICIFHYKDMCMCCIGHTALSCIICQQYDIAAFSTNQKCTPLK
jgi:hypothetical protein